MNHPHNVRGNFLRDQKEYNHDRFVMFYLADTPQVYFGNDPYSFPKINTKIGRRETLDFNNIVCPFCKDMMCQIRPDVKDGVDKNYATIVKGYDQLCHQCGERLCNTYDRSHSTLCHGKSCKGFYHDNVKHRSGVYISRHETDRIDMKLEKMGYGSQRKTNRSKLACKDMRRSYRGKICDHVLLLDHGWLY